MSDKVTAGKPQTPSVLDLLNARPVQPRHGFEWWEIDTTWMVIRALAAVGLAKDIHLLPKNAERYRITAEQPDVVVAAAA